MNHLLNKSYIATADTLPCRIVKHGAADQHVTTAAAATDGLMGITVNNISVKAGERIDVVRQGLADVTYGGTVVRDDPLTSDSVGRAIKAVPAAGVNARIIGFAEYSGSLGDLGKVLIAPGMMQG